MVGSAANTGASARAPASMVIRAIDFAVMFIYLLVKTGLR
jgi:hypothetical protein